MFKVTIDSNALQLAGELSDYNIDVMRFVNRYMHKVVADLKKQHGRPYTYVTPPGNRRKNIRRRSGKLLEDLENAAYTEQLDNGTVEGGFNISPASYLNIHVGEHDDPPLKITALGRSSLFMGRMAIPLRAALNADGTPKVLNPRMMGQLLILPAKTLLAGRFEGKRRKKTGKTLNNPTLLRMFHSGALKVDFSNEDIRKFHDYSLIVCKQSGRRLIPMFVLAKEISIPKRIFIRETMKKYYDDLCNKILDAVDESIAVMDF